MRGPQNLGQSTPVTPGTAAREIRVCPPLIPLGTSARDKGLNAKSNCANERNQILQTNLIAFAPNAKTLRENISRHGPAVAKLSRPGRASAPRHHYPPAAAEVKMGLDLWAQRLLHQRFDMRLLAGPYFDGREPAGRKQLRQA